MLSERKEEIKEIISLFDKAEDKVKEIELLEQELSIPAINELRYVGYHLARIFCENDASKIDVQINKAKGHCKRAIYDAHEIGIIHLLEQIKFFNEKNNSFSHFILEVIPTYLELLLAANKASKFISEIKENHRDNRDSYYQECEPHYQKLREIVDTFKVSEPLIDQKRIAYIEQDRKETRRYMTTILLTVLGITVSILGITIAST